MNANKDLSSMTFGQFKHVIDCLIEFGIKNIMLSGGEPCLHPDIIPMIQYIAAKGLKIGLVTNGTIINKELVECIFANNVIVQISIDAMDSDNYILSRGIDRLNQVVENIKLLNKNDIIVTMSITLNNATISEVKKVVDFALSNQIHTLHYGFLVPSDRCKENNMTMDQLFDALICLYEVQINKYLHIQIDFVENYVRAIVNKNKNPYYCNSMSCNNMEIQPNGDIYQCGALETIMQKTLEKPINIFNQDNVQIMNRIKSEWKTIGVYDIPDCKDCNVKYVCKGGCRAIVYQTFGNLYGTQPLCNELQKFISVIIKDYESGKLNSYIKYLGIVDNPLNDNSGYMKYF
jgi:radical SAM protein with 4Fe4S-binding SPASM domain